MSDESYRKLYIKTAAYIAHQGNCYGVYCWDCPLEREHKVHEHGQCIDQYNKAKQYLKACDPGEVLEALV